jgi:hypothetical protein
MAVVGGRSTRLLDGIVMGVAASRAFAVSLALWGSTICASEGPLTISIASFDHAGVGRIEYRDVNSHFHVVLSNLSDKPIKLWTETNSWGYYALSFEMSDNSGRKWVAKKEPATFTRNIPSLLEIPSRGTHVIGVYFAIPRRWEGFPVPENGVEPVTIRAVFEVLPTPESDQLRAWVGRIVSESRDVEFAKWTTQRQ